MTEPDYRAPCIGENVVRYLGIDTYIHHVQDTIDTRHTTASFGFHIVIPPEQDNRRPDFRNSFALGMNFKVQRLLPIMEIRKAKTSKRVGTKDEPRYGDMRMNLFH